MPPPPSPVMAVMYAECASFALRVHKVTAGWVKWCKISIQTRNHEKRANCSCQPSKLCFKHTIGVCFHSKVHLSFQLHYHTGKYTIKISICNPYPNNLIAWSLVSPRHQPPCYWLRQMTMSIFFKSHTQANSGMLDITKLLADPFREIAGHFFLYQDCHSGYPVVYHWITACAISKHYTCESWYIAHVSYIPWETYNTAKELENGAPRRYINLYGFMFSVCTILLNGLVALRVIFWFHPNKQCGWFRDTCLINQIIEYQMDRCCVMIV